MPRRGLAAAVLVCALVAVATMNGGGYRYGASDQAFYIPAVQRHLDPALFPRDREIIDSQDRLNVFTPILAAASRTTGFGLPALFAAGYLAAMAALMGAILALGRSLRLEPWPVVALGAAMTLRHRIARTGANTFEGYFHPRVLAFAVGAWAIVAFLNGRRTAAVVLVAAAALVHPTTALWFMAWLAVALVADAAPRARRWWLTAAAAASLGAAWFVWQGPLAGRLVRMDATWVALLADKDYLFPHQWPWWAWTANLAYPIVIVATYLARKRRGSLVAREGPMVAGAAALFGLLAIAVPITAAHVALVVQLQVPRVFWILDLLATAYAVWWLTGGWPRRRGDAGECEAALPVSRAPIRPTGRATAAAASSATTRTAARMAAILLLAAALARGAWVTGVEHPERPFVRLDLAEDAWHDAMRWLARQPASVHVLADPDHAWRYGSTVRVAASRDVLLEGVKDVSMAMYTRAIAARVIDRREALGDFGTLTAERARELARRYDLDYLVIDRSLDLPMAYRNARFWIYRLRDGAGSRQQAAQTVRGRR